LSAVARSAQPSTSLPAPTQLHEPLNRGYEWRFLLGLMARYERKAKLFPSIYATRKSIGPVRSIREFDTIIKIRWPDLLGFAAMTETTTTTSSRQRRVVEPRSSRVAHAGWHVTPRTNPSFACFPRPAPSSKDPYGDLCRRPATAPLRLPTILTPESAVLARQTKFTGQEATVSLPRPAHGGNRDAKL